MKGRIFGLLAALGLAAVGTALLVAYVRSAETDATADQEQVDVYVVSDDIARGTTVGDFGDAVELTAVPKGLVVDGAVTDLGSLDAQLVAAVDLLPGEQLARDRLVDQRLLTRAEVPAGLQEVTVALDPERAVGGVITPGSTVGILLSFDPFQRDESGNAGVGTGEGDQARTTPNVTTLAFNDVRVTSVQYGKADAEDTSSNDSSDTGSGSQDVAQAPAAKLLVTVAVDASQAQQLVFAAEFGHVWLTAQSETTDDAGSGVVTWDQVIASGSRA